MSHTVPFADIALDESRKRLYALNATSSPPKVEIFDLTTHPPSAASGTSSIAVDTIPLALAMSRSGKYLYVACYTSASLDIIDLDQRTKVGTVRLAANPEAVAVGSDERVLISTIGTSTGASVLAIYDPGTASLTALPVAPTAPTAPTLPAPSDNAFLSGHSRMVATPDGTKIIGVHQQSSSRVVWVYDVASATVLRSRTLNSSGTGSSPVTTILAVSPDGTKFMSGSILFDASSLLVLAQQSTSNAPFTFTTGASFTTLTSQGGAIFSPDGKYLYTAYNIVPLQSPVAQSNTSQLLVNAPGNLLIQLGIQLPETLNGRMVISSDGNTIYAISESGFMQLPIGTMAQTSPLAVPDSNVAFLATDPCGVTASLNSAVIPVRNSGGGKMTVTAQVLSSTSTSTSVNAAAKSYGADVTVQINSAVSKTIGTATPDQLLIQSPEAVNIIPAVRIYQNNRSSESAGNILAVDTGAASLGLTDLVADSARARLYIANPGMNRIEVFDAKQQKFLSSISVGQLPKSIALAGDGNTLYVANTNAEYLTVVDVGKLAVTGTVAFPPLPFGSTLAIITPLLVTSTEEGPQVLMSDGSLWYVVGSAITKRVLNSEVFGSSTTVSTPTTASMASSADGTYALLVAGNGAGYVYSATDDNFVATRQVVSTTANSMYFGPVAVGPNGSYFLVAGMLLNSSLTLVSGTDTSGSGSGTGGGTGGGGTGGGGTGGNPSGPGGNPGGGGFPTPGITRPLRPATVGTALQPEATVTTATSSRPVFAVAAVNAQSYLRFSTPLRASASTAATDAGLVELINASTLATLNSAYSMEGPATQVTGTSRVNVAGRTLAYDAASSTAYALTVSGLSIIPMTAAASTAPQVSSSGAIANLADSTSRIAPGGLFSILGKNLASTATYSGTTLPTTLGGVCVTLNGSPLPLLATAAAQINAQVPFTLAAGTYPLVVHSLASQVASSSVNVTVSKYAPAVFVDSQGANIYHADGTRVDRYHPASRDEPLTLYATGLGVTTGGKVTTGAPSPSSPPAVTASVAVYFGLPSISNSALIIDSSELVPGEIGVYQIACRIPGDHVKGDGLPVTVRIGGVSSSTSGANAPLVYVD